MRKNYIKEIIETFLGNEMPQEVQQAFGDWLRDPEARTEKEQTLETYWERLEAAERPAATGSWPACTKPSGAKRASAAGASGERSRRQRRSYCWPWASITSPHRATCAAGYRPTSSPRPTTKASTYYPTAPASGSTPAACCAITVIFRAASAWSSSPAKHSSKVRRDEKRPFILKADDMNIEVLGTEFDFINYAEFSTTEVILCSGSVRAFGGRLPRPVILKPGERLAYSKKDGRISLSQVTALNYSQWMNGELSFDNAPLSDIIANLQRWYAVEIDCPEEWARQVRMSFAVIRNESIDEILKAMSLVVDINYARENRHVTIIPRESRNHK